MAVRFDKDNSFAKPPSPFQPDRKRSTFHLFHYRFHLLDLFRVIVKWGRQRNMGRRSQCLTAGKPGPCHLLEGLNAATDLFLENDADKVEFFHLAENKRLLLYLPDSF